MFVAELQKDRDAIETAASGFVQSSRKSPTALAVAAIG
jgi:hypothetical protein